MSRDLVHELRAIENLPPGIQELGIHGETLAVLAEGGQCSGRPGS